MKHKIVSLIIVILSLIYSKSNELDELIMKVNSNKELLSIIEEKEPEYKMPEISRTNKMIEKISVNIKNTKISTILKTLGKYLNKNIIIGSDVKGNMSIDAKDVDPFRILEAVCYVNRYIFEIDRNFIKIREGKNELKTIFYSCKHHTNASIVPLIKNVLTPRGKVSTLPQGLKINTDGNEVLNNTLIITDVFNNISKIKNFIRKIDIPIKQYKLNNTIYLFSAYKDYFNDKPDHYYTDKKNIKDILDEFILKGDLYKIAHSSKTIKNNHTYKISYSESLKNTNFFLSAYNSSFKVNKINDELFNISLTYDIKYNTSQPNEEKTRFNTFNEKNDLILQKDKSLIIRSGQIFGKKEVIYKTPFVGSIPLLGNLFTDIKYETTIDNLFLIFSLEELDL